MIKSTKQLSISKTAGEWELIERKIAESGRKDLNHYIRCESIKIKNAFRNNPTSITNARGGDKIEKRPSLSTTTYNDIEKIAILMKIPVSVLIDRFIINPILTPKL